MGNIASIFSGTTFNLNFAGCFGSLEKKEIDKMDKLIYKLAQLQSSNTILPPKSMLSLLLLCTMNEYNSPEGQIILSSGEVIASVGITHREEIVLEIDFSIRRLGKILGHIQLDNTAKNIPDDLGERLTIFEDIISDMTRNK